MSAVRQQALTVVAPISRGQEPAVDAWLRSSERELQRALTRSTTTHFARWVVLPPRADEDEDALGAPHLLAFESNFDGELCEHVADLRACLGPLLDGAFQRVEGYPGSQDAAALLGFFRNFSQRAAAFYVAHGGLSVPVVRGDAALRRAVEERLQQLTRGAPALASNALDLALDLQRTARAIAAKEGLTLGFVERGLERAPASVGRRALTRPFAVLSAFLLAPWFELLDERARKPRFDTPARRANRDSIGREEDRVDQNGLTHLVPVKPGWYRAFALRVMLYLVTASTDVGALTGRVGGSQSTHFARWVALPDRRLLFLSNYDGSWEAYLGELIQKAARGLTMIWTNTLGFPKTRFLLFEGAKDEARFKLWSRAYQLPTQVWYSGYPSLSVGDVLVNAKVRELLGGKLSDRVARELLALL